MRSASKAPEGRTLLIVDDAAGILSVLRRLLRQEGFRILAAPEFPRGLAEDGKSRPEVGKSHFEAGVT